jgi:hypothetical protein
MYFFSEVDDGGAVFSARELVTHCVKSIVNMAQSFPRRVNAGGIKK